MPRNRKLKEHVTKRLTALDRDFDETKAYFKEIRDFIYPDGGWFADEGDYPNRKVKRHAKIIDDTCTRANTILGSGMQSGLTSPARPWLKLGLLDPDRDRNDQNREWLNLATKTMLNMLAGSNYYTSIHSFWEELGAFCTAVHMAEADNEDTVAFNTLTAGEYRVATNQRHRRCNVLYRYDQMTAQALIKEFGEQNVTEHVKNLAGPGKHKDPFKYITVVHAIEPREDYDPAKIDNLNMPWQSVWWEHQGSEDDLLLREGGYRMRNFFVSRWKVAGRNPYGAGLGKQALGNVKMLQEMQKAAIVGVHKEVNPPMKAPMSLKGQINLMPDSVTYYSKVEPEGIGPLYEVRLNLVNLETKIQAIQFMIERTYMNDLFLLITERPNMTATEVAERHEEKLLMLGPTIERQIHDTLDPQIDWTFYQMIQNDMLPPPPPDLQGQPLKVEYISLLAQAQRLVTGKAIESTLGLVERVVEVEPTSRFVVDYDEAIREYMYITGFPPEAERDRDDVEALRQAEIQQAEERARLEQAGAEADVAQKLGNTPLGQATALDALQDEFRGGATGAV